MDYLEDPMSDISSSLKLLKIHKTMYSRGGILLDHFMSLKYGLIFLPTFLEVSENKELIERIRYSVAYVKQKLYSLYGKDESLIIKLEHAYADLREEMKNVIIKPGTNEYDVIFPEIFPPIRKPGTNEDDEMFPEISNEDDDLFSESSNEYDEIFTKIFSRSSFFLCEKIKKLITSDCKAAQITPMMKELEDIRRMLTSLMPIFEYTEAVGRPLTKNKDEKKLSTTVTSVLDRATCFIYVSFVGKMDDEMVLSLKNSLSDLILEETLIMKMYLILDIYSIENLKSHISMSLRLLKWNKKYYVGAETGLPKLKDHFMSIKYGLQFLVIIIELSQDIALKQRIKHLVVIVKHGLYTLPLNQEDENLAVNLEHTYGELRKKMQNIVIKPGTNDYVSLFPEIFMEDNCFGRTRDFLLEKITKLGTSSCKAEQIAPMRKELEEVRKNLTSLSSFYNDLTNSEERKFKIFIDLTTFLDRATLLIYLSFVGKLDEDIRPFRELFSLLIGKTDIKDMFFGLGIILVDDLESDINISLSLLKRHEECQIGTINEAMLKDHIISLKHGIEFLRWLPDIYIDRDLKRRIILLAGNLKQKLELLTYEHGDESLNMEVNGAYADLREEMKNVIINPATGNYDTYEISLSVKVYSRRHNDFLLEKITSLLTSNCKADQITPSMKELQDLREMLTSLRPLCPYVENIEFRWRECIIRFLSVHNKVACLIYLSCLGKMETEMVLSVMSKISTTIKETDVWEMYKMILNEFLFKGDYVEEELYLLENLILLLKNNVESSNEASSKLYEVLIDLHLFLLGVYPNPNGLLRKRHLIHPLFQDILAHSIPILCSCYLEYTEQCISFELNSVLDLIKHIKFESQEIKLYYVPRVDDLGFLEFFSGYLEDLTRKQGMPMKEDIDALHFEVHSLLYLAKETNKNELTNTPWTDVINMAYQAEYIVDLYLVNSSRELGLISSLSKIIAQLKNIREDVHGLWCKGLPTQDVAVTSKPKVFATTTQVSDNDAIVGLQEHPKIIEHLLNGEIFLRVISIVGMAGIGKTTLARTIYKTLSMDDHFDILAWCAVSQSYQNRDLLLAILDQVNSLNKNHRIISEDQELAELLYRSLKKRKYLIVLDDIWDTTLWSYLRRYLPDDKEGSRILITTRNWNVADQMGSKVNELHELSKEKSWELFQKNMLEKESLSDDLLRISEGILEHCKGLPLSIVIIAGILSHVERTKKKFNQIEKSVSSFILSDPQGKCKDILQLSYNHLPNNLRSCFLYLGSFPVVYEISVNSLICLWIAEGLVQDTESEKAEEVAKKNIDDLIAKSLVIPAKEGCGGEVKTFRLHDLLHDFCVHKAKEEHFFTLLDGRSYSRPLKDPRRLVLNGTDMNSRRFSCHSIRSMICYDELKDSEIAKKIGSYDMVLLKVLEVGEVWSDFFPNISSLIHLRYLSLGLLNPELSVLPSSLSKLQNLQFLILRCKHYVIKVPDSIFDMVKLRHVHISPRASFEVDSNRLQNSSFLLENLTSLSVAHVSFGNSKWLSKLAGLERLHCVVEGIYLKDKQLQMLRFNGHLTCLKVENVGYWKQRFISTCELPTSIRKLTLSKFFLTSNDISEIGRVLSHLEVLKICRCLVPSRYKWNVDDEDFPELKVLKLRSLTISKWTVSENSFPRLERLWVEKCDYLDKIPLDFGSLPNLHLISVRECSPSVDDSAREIEKMQHEDQNTKMRARIYPRKTSHVGVKSLNFDKNEKKYNSIQNVE